MSNTKVLFAYCHELDRSVSIDEARTEYFSALPDKRKRFKFSCSDRHCNVSITGVNYHVKAEDGHKFKEAHFRSHVPHQFGCEWLQFTEDTVQEKRPDESEQDYKERKARQKLHDYINCFDPSIDDVNSSSNPSLTATDDGNPNTQPSNPSSDTTENPGWSRYTRTNQLQRLIDSWQEAKRLPEDEYRAMRINIVNRGQVYLHNYITHIKSGLTNKYDGVVYGGGKLVKRYGKGFLINFFDRHEDKSINLYVSKDIMNASRFGHYVDEILSTADVRYFRIFLLNPIVSEKELNNGKTAINLEITKLRQLAIYYELNTKNEDDSLSVLSEGESPA
ncbi:hypothetical protein [Pantoea sp. App145]|uniref:hypothetical protein n=1 Tax=Pantoea sp. App145 TaxID=3071567 RepID=UPI003A80982C